MKILVTGGTGLVGSQIVRRLVAAGHTVRILRRPDSPVDLLGEAAAAVEHHIGDVTDRGSVFDSMSGVSAVFHVAGAVGLEGKRSRARLFGVNAAGTAAVADAALDRGVERLVHTSSIAALGRPPADGVKLDENTEWVESANNSVYAASKRAAELEVHRGIAEGLDAVIVNPSLVFGPGRRGENTVRIFERIASGRLPGIPVGGTNVVDSGDVAAGHLLALERGRTGRRYILGSENLAWRTVIETIADALNVEAPRRVISPRSALRLATVMEALSLIPGVNPLITKETARQASTRFFYDNTRAVEELGCTFRPFEETARRVADWLDRPSARITEGRS